ncbi:hypothetical protein [Bradyrhizobium sp. 6(2017)]|uniref:hypothetical protein n=1 Tax=Bradyrhizobium sp. 6(2017) TaxID=1197460 RepID=UPI0013E0F4A1|nr:hypothetical protein [Bradyrhizobium sp. 6(2017)]QIG95548.1 hypothetical protein G6P99_26200 [Bradyrhizobium sp. 6(2017)]
MDRLKRITELLAQKTAIDTELKSLKDQIAEESAALKKPRQPRKGKAGLLAVVQTLEKPAVCGRFRLNRIKTIASPRTTWIYVRIAG